MNRSLSVLGRSSDVNALERGKERTEGDWGRMGLAIAIVAVSLGLLYLPYFLDFLWS